MGSRLNDVIPSQELRPSTIRLLLTLYCPKDDGKLIAVALTSDLIATGPFCPMDGLLHSPQTELAPMASPGTSRPMCVARLAVAHVADQDARNSATDAALVMLRPPGTCAA